MNFGDVLLLKFPFTDGQTFKRRPALLINADEDKDIIVCRITSKLYASSKDVVIENWETCGLKLPSIVRVHKIATLEKELVELVIGKIDETLKIRIKTVLANLSE